ncbi:MAG: RNA methyltransferase [Erysipelotrichaceae bacterium]|jgi:23S rRNA (guanosine2251-2'-O)-methyltransferase|nr:RNA methyltransferase [Erysipelotrichaceae bacterium]
MSILLEGALSVKAALKNPWRHVEKILIQKDKVSRDVDYLKEQATRQGVALEMVDAKALQELTKSHTHGGIVAFASPRVYQSLKDIKKNASFLAVLEGVQDPYTLGFCLRSLLAAGCEGVLLNSRDWQSAEATIVKSSAGASEVLPIVMGELGELLPLLHQSGFVIIGAHRKAKINYTQADFLQKMVLVLGGSLRGLSHKLEQCCDTLVRIDYGSDFRNALDLQSATAILSFEVLRQKREKHGNK